MRTTLAIDSDVLLATKELAKVQGRTAGQVLSALARAGLAAARPSIRSDDDRWLESQGFVFLPDRGVTVTNADVNRIRDELLI